MDINNVRERELLANVEQENEFLRDWIQRYFGSNLPLMIESRCLVQAGCEFRRGFAPSELPRKQSLVRIVYVSLFNTVLKYF
jgi:hypothetical protein